MTMFRSLPPPISGPGRLHHVASDEVLVLRVISAPLSTAPVSNLVLDVVLTTYESYDTGLCTHIYSMQKSRKNASLAPEMLHP